MLSAIAAALPAPPLSGDPADILADSLEAVLNSVHRHPETWRLILVPRKFPPQRLARFADDALNAIAPHARRRRR